MTQKSAAIDYILDNKIVSIEFLKMFTGNLIGEGSSRYVFDHPNNKKHVIKIDLSDWNANTNEFLTWQNIMEQKQVAKWFAPVIEMSPCGRVLIMAKANIDSMAKGYPKKLPSFFDDIKPSNFGFIGKQLVCVDYGIHALHLTGCNGFSMKEVNWFGSLKK